MAGIEPTTDTTNSGLAGVVAPKSPLPIAAFITWALVSLCHA